MKTTIFSLIALLVAVTVNLAAWSYFNRPHDAKSWEGTITGMSFSPLRPHHNPEKKIFPSAEEIEQDLALLEGKVEAVRIYSVTNGQEKIPELAAKHHLNVTAGAWIGSNKEANKQEILNLIQLAKRHRNVVRAVVGNEAILRQEVTVEEMIQYLRQVREKAWRPVSTAEPWHVWMAHPELAKEVDFIAVHILPYWEGIPVEDAVDYVFDRYRELQETFPGKPVVITEVGWPSGGQPIRQSVGSRVNQATFVREFLNRVHETDIIYYVVEAFDQPWKMSMEGSSGGYWGIYNAQRELKFPMQGKILKLPAWKVWAGIAAAIALLPTLLFLALRRSLKTPGKLLFGILANLAASTVAWTAAIGATQYQTTLSAALWVTLLVMQTLALAILLIEGMELAEVLWSGSNGKRNFTPLQTRADAPLPKVSIHVPIHNEPPEMVCQTLQALDRLDYPDFEVLVLDNNTTDPSVWQPVDAYCQQLGPRFRFFHLENWPGFKAGALNYGLEQTAGDAEIVAVIDSDYIVEPDWLKCLIPYFDKPDVGFVQAPQDYRDWGESRFKEICHWEYAGFFNIGMVQRNNFNAIIQHGTMTMIRKTALEQVGRWGEWCICEDSELGLRLYQAGYDSVYVNHSFGRGLTPDTLSAYKTQRFRWVYGAMQILKGHWKAFLPWHKDGLTGSQRFYFIAGWLPWFSDALALLFTFTSLLLTAKILIDPIHGELPVEAFVLPTLGLFSFKVLRSIWLYQARVKCSLFQTMGAALAGLALTHTVAKATLLGLFTSGRPFVRTPKCEAQRPWLSGFRMVNEEIIILTLLWSAAAAFSSLEHFSNSTGKLWLAVLLVQSTPYAAAVLASFVNIAPNLLGSGGKSEGALTEVKEGITSN